MADRIVVTATETRVRHIAQPLNNENGPHLGDLRAFVAACEGLDNDLRVHIDYGYLSESGRRNVEFRLTHRQVES